MERDSEGVERDSEGDETRAGGRRAGDVPMRMLPFRTETSTEWCPVCTHMWMYNEVFKKKKNVNPLDLDQEQQIHEIL